MSKDDAELDLLRNRLSALESGQSAKILSLEDRVQKVEMGEDFRGTLAAKIFGILLIVFSCQLLSGFVLTYAKHDVDTMWELASYVLSAVAAALAGVCLFLKTWVAPSSWVSLLILIVAYVMFLMSKHLGYGALVLAATVHGFALSAIFSISTWRKPRRSRRAVFFMRALPIFLALASSLGIWQGAVLLTDFYKSEREKKAAEENHIKTAETIAMVKTVTAATRQATMGHGKCSFRWVYEFPCVDR